MPLIDHDNIVWKPENVHDHFETGKSSESDEEI